MTVVHSPGSFAWPYRDLGLSLGGVNLTAAKAAEVIGCSRNHVYRLARQGRLAREGAPNKWRRYPLEAVERTALELLGGGGGRPYWATTAEAAEAAEILGVTSERVRQLADRGRIPAVRHRARWFFRREQLEVVANARDCRGVEFANPNRHRSAPGAGIIGGVTSKANTFQRLPSSGVALH